MARQSKKLATSITVLAWLSSVGAPPSWPTTPPQIRIPTPGGEVILSTPAEDTAYDESNYAPARRAGDYVYAFGVVVGRQPEGPQTPETFKDATRRAFVTLRARLQALGADFRAYSCKVLIQQIDSGDLIRPYLPEADGA